MNKPFGAPIQMGLTNPQGALGPSLSADELTIMFWADDPTDHGNFAIFISHRASLGASFDPPRVASSALQANRGGVSYWMPALSADGLTLFFSGRGPNVVNVDFDILVSTRVSVSDDFGPPADLTGPNSSAAEETPFITYDGNALWFESDRPGGWGGGDIWQAPRSGSDVDAAVNVGEINSGEADSNPVLSADGLTVYFASTRKDGTFGNGNVDMWVAHRPSATQRFSRPVPVTELNSPLNDYPGWLSVDACRLYLTTDSGGDAQRPVPQLYVATRAP